MMTRVLRNLKYRIKSYFTLLPEHLFFLKAWISYFSFASVLSISNIKVSFRSFLWSIARFFSGNIFVMKKYSLVLLSRKLAERYVREVKAWWQIEIGNRKNGGYGTKVYKILKVTQKCVCIWNAQLNLSKDKTNYSFSSILLIIYKSTLIVCYSWYGMLYDRYYITVQYMNSIHWSLKNFSFHCINN